MQGTIVLNLCLGIGFLLALQPAEHTSGLVAVFLQVLAYLVCQSLVGTVCLTDNLWHLPLNQSIHVTKLFQILMDCQQIVFLFTDELLDLLHTSHLRRIGYSLHHGVEHRQYGFLLLLIHGHPLCIPDRSLTVHLCQVEQLQESVLRKCPPFDVLLVPVSVLFQGSALGNDDAGGYDKHYQERDIPAQHLQTQ